MSQLAEETMPEVVRRRARRGGSRESAIFRYTKKTLLREILLLVFVVAFSLPAYIVAVLSLKDLQGVYKDPLSVPLAPNTEGYVGAWNGGLGHALLDSTIITGGSVILIVIIGSLGGYVLARRPSPFSGGLYALFVVGIILPVQLAVIPIFTAFRALGLTASYGGMILLYAGQLTPFAVFLFTGFIRSIPIAYEEAARVDGAGFFRTFTQIIFPLLMPAVGTVAILGGLVIWNDFYVPLIFLFGSDIETVPLALYSYVGENGAAWNLIMAAVIVAIAPILAVYLFAQRSVIQGFAGGLRG